MKTVLKGVCALLTALACFPAQAVQCPNGYTRALTLDQCPTYHYGASATDTTTTTVTLSGTNDAQGIGARIATYVHTSPYPPGCTVGNYDVADLTSSTPAVVRAAKRAQLQCINYDAIRTGSGAAGHTLGWLVVAGAWSQQVTALPSDTQLWGHIVAFGGACDGTYPSFTNCRRVGGTSVIETVEFSTDEVVGGGDQLVDDAGQARFIGEGGSNLNTGLTHAQRWLTLSQVNASLPSGTNVGLLNTTTFSSQRLLIFHPGTAGDWNIVGSYKLNGSSEPVWTVDGIFGPGTTDQKARILGTLTQSGINARNTDYSNAAYAAAGLGSEYGAYLEVYDTADYTEVRNLKFELVLGNVFYLRGAETEASLRFVIMDGIDGYNVASGLGAFLGGVQDAVLRNSTLQMWATCFQERLLGNPSYETCGPGAIPAVFVTARSINARVLYERNWAEDGIGEMFDFGIRSSYGIAAENFGSNISSFCGYADAGQWYVFERNTCFGDQNGNYGIVGSGNSGQGLGNSGGLGIEIEDFHGAGAFESINNLYRNNLLVNTGAGVNFGMGTTPYNAGKRIGGWVVGNTIIKAAQEVKLWAPVNVDQLTMKMNLFWNTSASTCDLTSQVDASHNHSYVAWADGDCADATNTSGDPQLALSNYTTWGNSDHTNTRTFDNAVPGAGSPVVNAGTLLTTTVLDPASYGFALDQRRTVLNGSITEANWAKLLYEDGNGNVRGCSGNPEIGLMERC